LTEAQLDTLTQTLKGPLIDEPFNHSTVISAGYAKQLGLPAELADLDSEQWRIIWDLWTRYYVIGCFPNGTTAVYEAARASHIRTP
jgi:hypothetical protein